MCGLMNNLQGLRCLRGAQRVLELSGGGFEGSERMVCCDFDKVAPGEFGGGGRYWGNI